MLLFPSQISQKIAEIAANRRTGIGVNQWDSTLKRLRTRSRNEDNVRTFPNISKRQYVTRNRDKSIITSTTTVRPPQSTLKLPNTVAIRKKILPPVQVNDQISGELNILIVYWKHRSNKIIGPTDILLEDIPTTHGPSERINIVYKDLEPNIVVTDQSIPAEEVAEILAESHDTAISLPSTQSLPDIGTKTFGKALFVLMLND